MRPGCVPDRRDRERHFEQPPVLRESDRLVVLDVVAPAEPGQDLVLLGLALVRDQQPDAPAHHLVGRVAEDPLRARIPAADRPIQRLAQDRVRGRVHDRREMGDACLLERSVADVGHGANSRSRAARSAAVGSAWPGALSATVSSPDGFCLSPMQTGDRSPGRGAATVRQQRQRLVLEAREPDARALYWAIYVDDVPVQFVMIAEIVPSSSTVSGSSDRAVPTSLRTATLNLIVISTHKVPVIKGEGSPIGFSSTTASSPPSSATRSLASPPSERISAGSAGGRRRPSRRLPRAPRRRPRRRASSRPAG